MTPSHNTHDNRTRFRNAIPTFKFGVLLPPRCNYDSFAYKTRARWTSSREDVDCSAAHVASSDESCVCRFAHFNLGDEVWRERLVVGHITGNEFVVATPDWDFEFAVVSIANILALVRIHPVDCRLLPGIAERCVRLCGTLGERDREAAFADGIQEGVRASSTAAGGLAALGHVVPQVGQPTQLLLQDGPLIEVVSSHRNVPRLGVPSAWATPSSFQSEFTSCTAAPWWMMASARYLPVSSRLAAPRTLPCEVGHFEGDLFPLLLLPTLEVDSGLSRAAWRRRRRKTLLVFEVNDTLAVLDAMCGIEVRGQSSYSCADSRACSGRS